MSKTLVMGILNITPDSFADGGKYFSKDAAINHGRRLTQRVQTLSMLEVNRLDLVPNVLVKMKNLVESFQ